MATINDLNRGPWWGDPEDIDVSKPGTASPWLTGVCYMGPWMAQGDGFAEHVRRSARALASTGCPVHLRRLFGSGYQFEPPPKNLIPLLETQIHSYSVSIYQVIVNEPVLGAILARPNAAGAPTDEQWAAINKRRVIYTVFERDRVSPLIGRLLNQVGQVWVATEKDMEMLARSGVDPKLLRQVPLPYFDDDPLLKLQLARASAYVSPPRFYHIGKWEPRKAQPNILKAFVRAFRPGEAFLCLKIHGLNQALDGFPQRPYDVLRRLLLEPEVRAKGWNEEAFAKHISVIDRFLSASDLRALHEQGDVYVSLSRGEGWDMAAYDAKLAGNGLVYTPSGGPQLFASERDFRVEPSGTIRCHPMYRWEPDAEYLDYDVDAAAAAMRRAAQSIGILMKARDVLALERFSAKTVGSGMLKNIVDLCAPDPVWTRRVEA